MSAWSWVFDLQIRACETKRSFHVLAVCAQTSQAGVNHQNCVCAFVDLERDFDANIDLCLGMGKKEKLVRHFGPTGLNPRWPYLIGNQSLAPEWDHAWALDVAPEKSSMYAILYTGKWKEYGDSCWLKQRKRTQTFLAGIRRVVLGQTRLRLLMVS